VQIPEFQCFRDATSYYAVLLHECGHASGAKHRLDRDLFGRFGSEAYAAGRKRPPTGCTLSNREPPQNITRLPDAPQPRRICLTGDFPGKTSGLSDLDRLRTSETWLPYGYRAEIAQMMVCAELGTAECEFTNDAAYIASWLERLRSDRKEIFRAAADAQRIAGLPPRTPSRLRRSSSGHDDHCRR
jgi:antirestriction protein ArdC